MSKEAEILNEFQAAFTEFRDRNNSKIDANQKEAHDRMDELERLLDRPNGGGQPSGLSHEDKLRKAAILDYCRLGGERVGPEVKAQLSVGSDPEGGYSVTPDMAGRIIQRIHELSPVRQISSVTNTRHDALEGLNDLNEAGAGWVEETASRTETSTPGIGKWRIPIHEQYALPKATQKLLDDSDLNIETWLIDKISSKFARMEASAFVNGDGVGKPRGFLTYPTAATADGSRAWGKLQHVVSGGAGAFASTNPVDPLMDLVFSLKADYLPNAKWVMGRLTLASVAKLKDADGRYLLSVGGGIAGNVPMSLLGFPLVLAEDMPALGADSYSLAFGDFGGYQIVDRLGISLLRDPFTTKGFVKFYTRRRVGGDVLDFDAIKLLKFSAS